MIVLYPVPLKPTDLIDPAGDPSTFSSWDPEREYEAGDRVSTPDGLGWKATITSYTTNGTTYSNLGIDPSSEAGFHIPYGSTVLPETVLKVNPNALSYWWALVTSAGNVELPESDPRFAFLYDPISNRTQTESPFTFSIKPRFPVGGVALFGLVGTEVTLEVGEFSQTKSLLLHDTFSGPAVYSTKVAFLSFPDYSPADGTSFTVTVSNSVDPTKAAVGRAIFGLKNRIGFTNYGTELGFRDFSRVDRDTFGEITIIRREFASTSGFKFELPTGHIDQTRRLLSQLRATPAVFLTTEDRMDTAVYGFYDSLSLPIEEETWSQASLNTEGLV